MKFLSQARAALVRAWMFTWLRLKRPIIGVPVVASILILTICIGWCNYLDSHQIGIARNSISGEMWMQGPGGIYITGPWVRVSRVDTRPMRVSVESAGRAYSGKLVQFVPEHWEQFVEVEGFRYWWWGNRFSFNWGHQDEYRGIRNILRGYAYSPKVEEYEFVAILEEYATRQ